MECPNKKFIAIPKGIDPGTQVLDFSSNSLGKLMEHTFLKLDLINLQRLYLSKCELLVIEEGTFKGLTNLVELDLSENKFEFVPTDAFIDTPSLMRLSLNLNPVTTLKRSSFSQLSFLNTLELSNCKISQVEEGAFQGLHSLEWLHLDGNKLNSIGKVLPDSLKGVELQGNDWACDCRMLDLHSWLTEFKIPLTIQPVCKSPQKFEGKQIKSLDFDNLACLPEVSPTSFYLEIGEGKNVSLLCHVKSIPEAQVNWWFQGQLLQNDSLIAPGMRLLYYLEEGQQEKTSELLIYNVNSEDNGTYFCTAENPAGVSYSNYTVRIIVKEEPVVVIVSFPYEYLLAAIAGVSVFVLILIVTIIVLAVKCKKQKRREEKRQKTKEVALQYQQNFTGDIDFSNNLKTSDEGHHEMVFFGARSNEDLLNTPNQMCLNPDQNPDLINDTESVERKCESLCGEQDSVCTVAFPVSCLRGSRKVYSGGSWGYGQDAEGYPPDYGLPKVQQGVEDCYYRTLPYKRPAQRQNAANPMAR